MIIILCPYLVALCVFSKFRLLRWGWLSGTISLGGFILAIFLAFFVISRRRVCRQRA